MKHLVSFIFLLILPCFADAELTLIGGYDTEIAAGVAVLGNYAYVADFESGLRIIDISNPANPVEAGYYDMINATTSVAVSGNYAYVVDFTYIGAEDALGCLHVFDISNPANPVKVGSYCTPGLAMDVSVSNTYAYVVYRSHIEPDDKSGLRIFDISNASSPTPVGFYNTPDNAYGVAISGCYAYVADGTSGLRIISITDPANPLEVGFYDTSGRVDNVAVSGGYAYLVDNSDLRIIDISDPALPIEVSQMPGFAYSVTADCRYAYLAGSSLRIIDITNPYSPAEVGFYSTQDIEYDVTVSGSYIYVANGYSGLLILADITCIDGYNSDASGNKLEGWTIFVDEDGDGIFDAGEKNSTTNSDGHWKICGLLAGDSVNVTEVPKSGWTYLDPAAGRQTITVQLENKTGPINFTNIESKNLIEDLGVSKVAQVNGIAVAQVNPGQIFNYNISVINKNLANDAPQVVVTDKLPNDVEYLGAEIYTAAPQDYTINQSGDLVYVRFDQIPAGSTRYINITVKAPAEAPATLYNIVNLRYRYDQNQSDNSMTLATYVPLVGYNQTEAAKSFEDLLHNQSQLLFQFEDLLHTIPANNSTNYSFLVSFEQLLRSQAALTSSFEDLLSNESSTGWDSEYSEDNRTALLWSYEQMLYDEAFLFASFNAKLNESWNSLCDYTANGHSQDAQTELIASFEDLLKRQTRLYKSFNLLLKKIDISSQQDMVDFLAAYENLMRVEANLLMSFNELLEVKYENSICP